MFACPHCGHRLQRVQGPYGVSWACPSCHGRGVGVGLLRRLVFPDAVDALWVASAERGVPSRPCAICGRAMRAVVPAPDLPTLDVCSSCHFVWFDPSEYEQMPGAVRALAGVIPSDADARATEILATATAEQVAARSRGGDFAAEAPAEKWKLLPALLGMPVEFETSPLRQTPWVTWLLAAFIIGFSLAAFRDLENAVTRYGLIPAQAWRLGGVTFLTSFLLHGGLFHLIGNMYFLFVFGDNVEDALGKGRYLAVLLLAALVGDFAHIALEPRSEIPVIGASGGISALVLYYALKYPRARLGILFRIFLYFRWVRVPAYAYVGFWVAMQLYGAYLQVAGTTNVSALAHLGGAAVGLAAWLLTRET